MSKIVTANLLLTGEVVYLTPARRWSPHFENAVRFSSREDEEQLLAIAAEAVRKNAVVDVTTISLAETGASPVRLRERIRALGPTVHPQFARRGVPAAA
ncbi:MAG: DUF2849 domain-containing protein [Rhodospirillaceae bacterium]|nr:DUF2849 domain-containing protein [Rhodospirillaceae bacterium]